MIVLSEKELRKECQTISKKDGLLLLNKLSDELDKNDIGIGLSAPQIGEFYKAFVIKTNKGNVGFLNPQILEYIDPFINLKEGCLSFPAKWISTIRYNKIKIKDDLNGEQTLNNLSSVVAQHETDHTNSVIMFDREAPGKYDKCFCGSEEKFKYCCYPKCQK